jgi:hypothetical protein
MLSPMRARSIWLAIAALGVLTATVAPRCASAAPATAHRFAIQGVLYDVNDQLLTSGDIAVRIYSDSLGGAPVFDSGTQFAGNIANGVFDVMVGQSTPLMLDHERAYFLELDAAAVEILGDAAGGRWRFFPGGGSRARTDLEARLDTLESVMGITLAARNEPIGVTSLLVARPASGAPFTPNSGFANVHGMLGLGKASGSAGGITVNASLLTQPLGPRSAGNVQAVLGPYYLYAPPANPMIRFIHDIPGDQGRSVRIRWRADLRERSYSPSDPAPRITSYTIYRRVEPGQSAPLARTPGEQLLGLPPGDWDVLTTIPATLDTAYQTVVPTLCDSTSTGNCLSTFLVRSITDQPGTYHNSLLDTGYSVDNLAPGVPTGFVAQSISGGTQLTWQASTAPDFQYFRVYRGTDPDFVPGAGTLVHATETTSWTDIQLGPFTYKLTALDFNGNESAPATVSITVGVTTPEVPKALAFASIAPNPFRRSLSLVIEIPRAAGMVDLTLFDLAGRRVRTLVNGPLAAGRYTYVWDCRAGESGRVAPGVYLARLRGAGRTITRRMTLIP